MPDDGCSWYTMPYLCVNQLINIYNDDCSLKCKRDAGREPFPFIGTAVLSTFFRLMRVMLVDIANEM